MKSPLLKSPDKYSHASQFTKHFSSQNFEVDTLIQLSKWWDDIISAFYQSLSKQIDGRHKNHSKHHIMIYQRLLSHRKPIQSQAQKNKNIKH